MKKALAFVLALTALFALAGCNTAGNTQAATTAPPQTSQTAGATQAPTETQLDYLNLDSTMPIVKEGSSLTLKLISVQGDWVTATPKDHWIWAFFKKYCNLDLDVKYYQAGSWSEQRNLLFTSGDLPDIFYQCPFDANDIVRYGQAEGMFYPLEGLISQYAPLIQQTINQHPNFSIEATTPDGHMYCIPRMVQEGVELNTARVFINQSWLDKGKMKMPATVEELIAALKFFKDGDPNGNGQEDEIPWLASAGNGSISVTLMLTALGMNTDTTMEPFVKSDGKTISIAVAEDNYIHYLEYMKQMMADGLINSDLYTMTPEQISATLSKNIVGLSGMAAPFVYMPEPEQYRQYESLVPLTSAYNSEKVWTGTSAIVQGTFAISHTTKYPEACIRMANVFFEHDQPGGMALLFFVGSLKSDSYEPKYTVEGWEPVTWKYDNGAWTPTSPDGTDLWTYINNRIGITTNGPVGVSYKEAEVGELLGKASVMPDNESFWRASMQKNVAPYEKLKMPTLFFDVQSLERVNELITPITDYIKTMEAKFITGNEPLENIAAFKDQLKKLGIEEYLQIYQKAYDAYLANAK